jgi:hypothetical protein
MGSEVEMSQSEEPLSQERSIFEANLAEWRAAHLGQYVLIKDATVIGFYNSLDEAFGEGTRRFGLDPFFVKQIHPEDVVNVSLYSSSSRFVPTK